MGRGTCEWSAPAHDPFQGDVPSAVDRYTDIPADTRERLKARMKQHAYDDIVSIRRDAIEGRFRYEPELLDMHFGKSRLCGTITRKTWTAEHEERGLAYCEDGHCVVVPLVCRNVSRITRKAPLVSMGAPAGGSDGPLVFDPPAAGIPAATPEGDVPTARTLQADPSSPVTRLPAPTDGPLATVPVQPLPGGDGPAGTTPQPTVPGIPIDTPGDIPPVVVAPPPQVPGLIPQPDPVFPPITGPPGVVPLPPAVTPPVPEPATVLMWIAGLAAGAWWQRRRAKAQA